MGSEQKIIRFELDSTATKDYMIDQLKHRHTFARILADVITSYSGEFFTFLPEHISYEARHSFHLGAKMPRSGQDALILPNGETVMAEAIPNSERLFVNQIRDFLNDEQSGMILVEDLLGRPNDKSLKDAKALLSLDDEVYFFLIHDNVIWNTAPAVLNQARSASGYVGAMVNSYDPGIFYNRHKLSLENLQAVADRALTIFVTAYGLEGYVYWKRHKSRGHLSVR